MIISYQKIGYRRKLVLVLFISIILVMLTKINIKEGLGRDNAPILFVEYADYTEDAFDINDEAEDIYEELDGILPEGLDSTEDVLDLSLFGELILGTVSDRARGCGGFLITFILSETVHFGSLRQFDLHKIARHHRILYQKHPAQSSFFLFTP